MLSFDNSFVRELPADPDATNRRRQVHNACYSYVAPTPVTAPRLIAYSREVADLCDLEVDDVGMHELAEVFAGNKAWPGMDAYAACYGGHQFGAWAGQLGDGRAIGLGEVVNRRGERWELQLKGAGPTPYSRTADGRAVLRSSIREFLCSEAMHHLGVPTTRALSLVTTGEQVVRDMFYDGNARSEPGAVVCRVSPSFIRFGNFEIFAARDELDVLKTLADYTIRVHFPELGDPCPDVYLRWLAEISRRTAIMIAHWMRVGFVHGVMNTDNMSVLGLTIDYGPYGWLDNYDAGWTPNTTDASGRRYRFGHQPNIAMWNLVRFANAIYPLIGETEPIESALKAYPQTFERAYREMMANKLGLGSFRHDEDDALIADLFAVLQATETDMTIFYRRLANIEPAEIAAQTDDQRIAPLLDAYYSPAELDEEVKKRIGGWLCSYAARLMTDDLAMTERRAKMNRANPKYVLRNYLAQLAIDKAETGEPTMVDELLEVMRRPYDEQPEHERYAEKRPDWARTRPGCSALSCSS
ncbi:MAG: YdiU family protein [Myxococcales bacterium]|nr:YdiU family protein [Myxococcales bacterium]MDH3842819.1 YdiU family protein [Myxococcales bacterium]